ncbi:MAG: tetratricopeptide repeat protein, partial [Solirubrobacteraceae bacterium]|nr:tetratricopeptide repeat protein [Solirubrobacteraceae bacterium]
MNDDRIGVALEGDGEEFNTRGIAHGESGRITDACRFFRVAISLGNTEALANLGKALRMDGDPEGAAAALRSAVEAGFSSERVWLGVVLYDHLGREEEGEELLRNAYVDGELDAAHQLALTMLLTDRNDEAIALLERLPAEETTGDVLDSLSSALRFAGRPAEALDAADRAIAAGHDDAMLNRAFALAELRDP